MKKFNIQITNEVCLVSLVFFLTFLVSCSKEESVADIPELQAVSLHGNVPTDKKGNVNVTVTEFASNIPSPRGLKFGPDGYLYVASAGTGGTTLLTSCEQVIPPVGPYLGGNTSSILKISPAGVITNLVSQLPSDVNALGFTMGVADIEFVENQLYALLDAGCSHGNPDYPTSVIKVNNDGSWSVVANISDYLANNPVAAPEEDDFEPDGTLYDLINVRGNLYSVEPNRGDLIKITTDGTITRVLDFSAQYGHNVPTSIAFHGNFYVGNLRTFPLVKGSSKIFKVTPDGEVKIWAEDFTGILGVAFDAQNRMYVLETSAVDNGPAPGTGRVVRLNNDHSRDVIIDNLTFPTGMTFGPEGALYISNAGFGPPVGQILKVEFN
ncbi:ScyD/ScyE family protein [Christiangramia fulva]|uniref:ScyD/ScyE family protein n=1 Tax=Christiangramia fulva TaxID=2126553 RepID=A0A2R3Z4W5_9FLAO|nr:ScyD/ScyE family protein [Christiangramia fulva]AVR45310.1 ScyD/ScyE family protein [Christiangramia fulva]